MIPRILLASLLVFFVLLPGLGHADKLPAKMEKDIFPGVTYVTYADQTFRFETSVPIHVSFILKGISKIQLSFKAQIVQGPSGQQGPSTIPMGDTVTIYWADWDTNVYDAPPPEEEWVGIMDTESGYTEK